MSTQPNAGHVVVPDTGDLKGIRERLEKDLDTVTSHSEQCARDAKLAAEHASAVGSLKEQLTAQQQVIETQRAAFAEQVRKTEALIARCDHLDRIQDRGHKLYLAGGGIDVTGKQKESVTRMGSFLVDAYRIGKGMDPITDIGLTRADLTALTRAQTIGTTTEGGNAVKLEIMDGVQWLRDQFGLARQLCTVVPMGTNEMPIPTSTVAPTISYPGEATAPSDAGAALINPNKTLTSKRPTAIDDISLEFFEDTTPGTLNFVTERFLEAMAGEEDRVFLSASNSPTGWYGVLHAAGVGVANFGNSTTSGNVSFHQIAYLDLVRCMSAADEKVHETGTFVFSSYMLDQLRSILDTQNRPIFAPMEVGAPPMLLGRPWKVNSNMPKLADSTASTACVAYGDYKKTCFFGDRRSVDVAFSDDFKFSAAVVTMRIMQRFAFVVALPAGIGRLRTAAS